MMLLTQLTAITWLLTFDVTQTYKVKPPQTQYLPNGLLRGGNAGVTVVTSPNAVEDVTPTVNFKPSDGRKGVLCYPYNPTGIQFPVTIPAEQYTPAGETIATIDNCVKKCAELGKYTYAAIESGGDTNCYCFNDILGLPYWRHGCSSCLYAYGKTLASEKGCFGAFRKDDDVIIYVMTTCPDGYYGPPGCLNRGRKECKLNSPRPNMPNAECDLGNIVQFDGRCFHSDTPLAWCSPNPCKNGGACYNDACTCTSFFTGINCETGVDPCTAKPCSSRGTCEPKENTYHCVCSHGFTGRRCEQDINECQPNPCRNGGKCQNDIGRYICTCPPNASGANCQTVKGECSPNPCSNDGTCRVTGGQSDCICVAGYNGQFCETDINECESGPCKFDQTCKDKVNYYECFDKGAGSSRTRTPTVPTVTENSFSTKDPGRMEFVPSSSMSLHGAKGIIQLLTVVVLLWSLAHDHALSARSAKTSVSLYSCHITV